MRVNAFIIAKAKDNRLTHKEFLREWISTLLTRGHGATAASIRPLARTRRDATNTTAGATTTTTTKRRRMSNTRPSLPIARFDLRPEDHQATTNHEDTPKACIYCSYEIALQKGIGVIPTRPVPKKIKRRCSYCQVFLCKEHFDVFHDQSSLSIDDL
jgi:hypothetical protein